MQAINTQKRSSWQLDEVLALFAKPFHDLLFLAASTHRQHFNPNQVQLSTLLSIKTGSCPEDCKYCPQSAHYKTEVEKESLLDKATILEAARKAKASGAGRFCMGAAWRQLADRDLPHIESIVSEVKSLDMEVCVTLGMANKDQLTRLKEAGLDYYNHNIDTSEAYYDKIITTRCFEDRLNTLENIRQAGLNTCCGGIVGLGETIEDRANMLLTLANLPVPPQSVPINRLVKVKGTPMSDVAEVSDFDFIRVIAVARILMPTSYVRLSAGRESMSQTTQALCFFAGANSIFYGEKLLTAPNNEQDEDRNLFAALGIEIQETQPQEIATIGS